MASTSVLDGVFAINKPYGMSSAQVIRDCKTYFNPSPLFAPMLAEMRTERAKEAQYEQHHRRRKIKQAIEVKMGHGGTLDPMATGVLILGIGRGTKSLQQFLTCTKTYETVVVFGAISDTYDRCGKLINKRPYEHITREKIEAALASFRGTYQQMPPLFSALKMEGKPLYEYARAGLPIPREIQTREVTVTDLKIIDYYEPGTHHHHWPTEESTTAEKQLAEEVFRVEKQQKLDKTLSAEEHAAETEADEEHKNNKRKLDGGQDGLVQQRQTKKQKRDAIREAQKKNRIARRDSDPVLSGALGDLPPKGKGHDLVPPVEEGTAPPWEGKGPPAVRIRMTSTSGFYVRSFAHDLGEKLESAGLMTELIRQRQADFVLGTEDCLEYDDLAKGEDVWAPKLKNALCKWRRPGGIKGLQAEEQEEAKATSVKDDVKKKDRIVQQDIETKLESKESESKETEQKESNVMDEDEPVSSTDPGTATVLATATAGNPSTS